MTSIQITGSIRRAVTAFNALSSSNAAAPQGYSHVGSSSSFRVRALVGLGQALWPLCQDGLSRLVCHLSADRGRCLKFAKVTSGLSNSKPPGGFLFAMGVAMDAWHMNIAIHRSLERKTLRPAAAQATRSLTTWGAAWAGAELLGLGGALAGIETGPGALVTGGIGALVGGCLGMFASDWLAQKIEPPQAAPLIDDSSLDDCAC